MKQLSLEEAVRIGMALRRVTSDPAFDTCVEVMKEQYRSAIFDSKPSEVDKREQAYAEARALDELLITFNTFISLAEADADDIDEDQIDIYE